MQRVPSDVASSTGSGERIVDCLLVLAKSVGQYVIRIDYVIVLISYKVTTSMANLTSHGADFNTIAKVRYPLDDAYMIASMFFGDGFTIARPTNMVCGVAAIQDTTN